MPVTLIVSPDSHLTTLIGDALAGYSEIDNCLSLNTTEETLRKQPAAVCIVDLRELRSGGHAEADFLESLPVKFPNTIFRVVTLDEIPETVERSCVCARIHRYIGDAGILALIDELNGLWSTAVSHVEPTAAPAEKVSESAVLNGLTRRFETRTPQTKMMLADLEVAARHDVTVLLIGETGAGKTFLSKLIHEVSPRRGEPFLPVACGALPADLIESELFGHVRGAFTSANSDKDGKFVAAGRGTILLDEIDVLGPEQQVKLLRVIESGEFEPVGSNQTIRSQARLIVASNLDLQPLVKQGKFRPDLYYRLNMLKFELPPLRARRPDIIPMAQRFIEDLSTRHGIEIKHIDQSLFQALYNYPWPGNVRELENVIQRAVIYCRDGVLTAAHLPANIVSGDAGPTNDASVNLGSNPHQAMDPAPSAGSHLGKQIALTEREIIEQALFNHNYSRTNTAKSLGISRVTLYNKMKKYGMT